MIKTRTPQSRPLKTQLSRWGSSWVTGSSSYSLSFPLGLTTFGSDWHYTTARCCPWGPLRFSLHPPHLSEQSQRDILASFISVRQEVVQSLARIFQKAELWLTVAQTASCQALRGGPRLQACILSLTPPPPHLKPGWVLKVLRPAGHGAKA